MLSVSRYIDTNGKMLFELAKQQGLEGVVGKKKDSLYWFGKRTKDWNKVKVMVEPIVCTVEYIESVVSFTIRPQSRKSHHHKTVTFNRNQYGYHIYFAHILKLHRIALSILNNFNKNLMNINEIKNY